MTPFFMTPAWSHGLSMVALPGVLLVRVGAFSHAPVPAQPKRKPKPRPVFSLVPSGSAES